MPDWRQLVRERLPLLPLPGPREEEIHEELAQQLEQSYDEALIAGAGAADALSRALAQIGDWRLLAAEIAGAELGTGEPPGPAAPDDLGAPDDAGGGGGSIYIGTIYSATISVKDTASIPPPSRFVQCRLE
jgi:hypothetical protein